MLRRFFLLFLLAAAAAASAQEADTITVDINSVVVEGERRPIRVEDGRILFETAALAREGGVSTLWEALKQLPGVAEEHDRLTLAGQGPLSLLLNGKPTSMSAEQLRSLLETTPVGRAERLELSYNAPPRWGVRGAAINILMKRRTDERWSGEVHGSYARKGIDSWQGGGTLLHTGKQWYADASFDLVRDGSRMRNGIVSRHRLHEAVYDISQMQHRRTRSTSYRLHTTLERAAEGRSTLSAVYTGAFTPEQRALTHAAGTFVDSEKGERDRTSLHNLALRFRSADNGWSFSADYTHYRLDNSGRMCNRYASGNLEAFLTTASQQIDRLQIDLDRMRPLSDRWSLEWGAHAALAAVDNRQIYTPIATARPLTETRSDIDEQNVCAYAGITRRFSHGSLSAALTGEFFRMDGRTHWTLYPQATLQWTPRENHLLQLSFATDKSYPAYWQTRDFVSYLDGYAEIHGTPDLPPVRTCSANLLYLYRQRYMLLLFHHDNRDDAPQTAWQADDRLALIYQCIRADYTQLSGVQVTAPVGIGRRLQVRPTGALLRQSVRYSNLHGLRIDRTHWTGNLSATVGWEVAKWMHFSLDGFFQASSIQSTYDIDPCWGIDARVKWTFDRGRASFVLGCDDLLATARPKARVRHYGQHLDMDNTAFNTRLHFRFDFRFTGYKERRHEEIDTSRFGK